MRCVGAKLTTGSSSVSLFHTAHQTPSLCNHSVPSSLHLSSLYLIPPSSSLRGISTSPLGHSCIILDRLFHLQRSCFWSGLLSCLWITDELLSTFSGNLVECSVGQERAPLHFWTDSRSLGRYTYYFSLLENELDSVVVNGQDSKCSISGISASKAVNQRNNSYFQHFCLKNKRSSISTQSYRKGSHQMSGMSLRQIKRCHILLPEGSLPYLCILNKAAVTLFVIKVTEGNVGFIACLAATPFIFFFTE